MLNWISQEVVCVQAEPLKGFQVVVFLTVASVAPDGPWRPNITASSVEVEVRRGHFSALVRSCNFGARGNSRQDFEEAQ
jgi:hypothetical protein